ncbi:MAG: hypothetical protein DU429_03100 [Candidatus Tokpelaia sp.]|uniref:hypothetical protein n=1 Tax=Candidatus Tokpelaia sp. TaxID=2233777 RepID=UPI00123BB6D7|nr:hypothetical protein [Candidatus Tokpelaia sp.]KAA6205237.1 MAG: hypothetical protein DU430_05845 [Candidatus Tokpelaia sp.]KAA6207450.1 MAG: hypothetical protein DU429_03100 [Candidatus Tokpelaia sp.]KAA6405701.1 hypothetical protein DPQ22_03325 [Candidatus Tokpelaia sp.]
MKIVSFVLAVVSIVLVLVLAAFTYDTNSRLAAVTESQGSSRSSLASDVTKTQATMDKIEATVKDLQQNLTRLAADDKQNAAAIDDMKKRINRLIDLIK